MDPSRRQATLIAGLGCVSYRHALSASLWLALKPLLCLGPILTARKSSCGGVVSRCDLLLLTVICMIDWNELRVCVCRATLCDVLGICCAGSYGDGSHVYARSLGRLSSRRVLCCDPPPYFFVALNIWLRLSAPRLYAYLSPLVATFEHLRGHRRHYRLAVSSYSDALHSCHVLLLQSTAAVLACSCFVPHPSTFSAGHATLRLPSQAMQNYDCPYLARCFARTSC